MLSSLFLDVNNCFCNYFHFNVKTSILKLLSSSLWFPLFLSLIMVVFISRSTFQLALKFKHALYTLLVAVVIKGQLLIHVYNQISQSPLLLIHTNQHHPNNTGEWWRWEAISEQAIDKEREREGGLNVLHRYFSYQTTRTTAPASAMVWLGYFM